MNFYFNRTSVKAVAERVGQSVFFFVAQGFMERDRMLFALLCAIEVIEFLQQTEFSFQFHPFSVFDSIFGVFASIKWLVFLCAIPLISSPLYNRSPINFLYLVKCFHSFAFQVEDSFGRVSPGDREFLIYPAYGSAVRNAFNHNELITSHMKLSNAKKPFDWMTDEQYNGLQVGWFYCVTWV